MEGVDGYVLREYRMAWLAQGHVRQAKRLQEPSRSSDLGAGRGRATNGREGVGGAMNRTLVDRVVNAVLYEGYILYPYRPSVKNRLRWTFGGLYPEAYCKAQAGNDAASNQTECLVYASPETILDVTVRFLHLTERVVGEISGDAFRPVEALRMGDQVFHTWQEAQERNIDLAGVRLVDIAKQSQRKTFRFPGRRWQESLCSPGGKTRGVLAREQQ